MRTRETIEALAQSQSVTKPNEKAEKKRSPYGRGKNPKSLKNLVAPWQPGEAPKSPGRPKLDVAQLIVRKAFEDNQEIIYKACVQQLAKGGAFAFQVYSDRAYGKMKESLHVDGSLSLSDTIRKARERAALPAKETSATE